MIRVLLIFAIAVVVAGGAVWIADRPGVFYVEWQNREIQGTVGGALLIVLIFLLISMLATYLYFVAQRVPAMVQQRAKEQKQNRGLVSLTKGLVAISTGDAGEAKRFARQANSLLPDQPLTQVLLAQAAQANGDPETANQHYKQMLSSPATELLGLQGLIQNAISAGNQTKAIEYAERAYRIKPKSPWAYKALVQYQSSTGNWDTALETVERGSTAGVVDLESAKRKKGIFLTAKAYRSYEAEDYTEAEALAVRAQRLFPGFTPAAIMAANALAKKGNQWAAAGTLEEAWREEPHPAIIDHYIALKANESPRARNGRLMGLAEMKPGHLESGLLRARLFINTRDWAKARQSLEPHIHPPYNPRVSAMMAEISQGDGQDEGAAREWMARAVTSEPESDWLHTDFDFTDADWASLADAADNKSGRWPPQTIAGRKSGYAPQLGQLGDDEDHSSGESLASSRVSQGPELKSSPVTELRVSAHADNVAKRQQIIVPPPRPKSQQTKKKKLKLAPTGDGARQEGNRPATSEPAVKSERTEEAKRPEKPDRAERPQKSDAEAGSLPRQPDDPGPVS